MMLEFENANEAFTTLYFIVSEGKEKEGTKYKKNVHFTIKNPIDRDITCSWRKWNKQYAEYEWQWYLSGNPNADNIAKFATIWKVCQDINGNVNSNYGYQWERGGQLDYVISELKHNPNSRRAVISIYDGKENDIYALDTPCTLAITFTIEDEKVDMHVHMRSNDLVFGFCNDQYCFSKLQELVARELNRNVGQYHHSVVDMHIYKRHWNMHQK